MLFCNSDCIHSDYDNVSYLVYTWGFLCLHYFFDVLISWSRKLSLYKWFCPYSVLTVLPILWCFLSLRNSSGYINSGYSDARYKVYIWGFLYLDYSFDVLISRISNLGVYNWFCHFYFTCYLISCFCMSVLTTWFSVHAVWLGFIDTRVVIYARHLAFILPLVGEFLIPLDLHIQILELGLWWTSWWAELQT